MQEAEWEAIPPYFSPNGDGYLDEAQLYFKCEGGASVITLDIFSAKGEKIRSLAEYDYSAEQGYFTWDGFNSEGQLLSAGIYIAVLEYYNDQGISAVMRTPIVLSR
jgi:flagellar hook assembly protein FlgD